MPLELVLTVSAFLFCTGVFGVLTRRNIVGVLLSIELILNAANLNLVAFSRHLHMADGMGEVFALFIIALAAAGSVVGLVLIIAIYRNMKSIYSDEINTMKW